MSPTRPGAPQERNSSLSPHSWHFTGFGTQQVLTKGLMNGGMPLVPWDTTYSQNGKAIIQNPVGSEGGPVSELRVPRVPQKLSQLNLENKSHAIHFHPKFRVPHEALSKVFLIKANVMSSFRLQVVCVILDFKGKKFNLARQVLLNVQISLSAS